MHVTVSKWGNSLGIRIPKAVSDELQLREGSSLSLEPESGGFILKPATPRVAYLLADLVAEMKNEPEPEVIDWGPDAGEEIIEDGGW